MLTLPWIAVVKMPVTGSIAMLLLPPPEVIVKLPGPVEEIGKRAGRDRDRFNRRVADRGSTKTIDGSRGYGIGAVIVKSLIVDGKAVYTVVAVYRYRSLDQRE